MQPHRGSVDATFVDPHEEPRDHLHGVGFVLDALGNFKAEQAIDLQRGSHVAHTDTNE
jgi:hypothetical protein